MLLMTGNPRGHIAGGDASPAAEDCGSTVRAASAIEGRRGAYVIELIELVEWAGGAA